MSKLLKIFISGEKKQLDIQSYDIVVIGGGPAGMFAAGFAAQKGKNVLLIEKNDRLGKKLLITGKGRCNITNSETDIRKFISVFGNNGKFLFSVFHRFSSEDAVKFFNDRGLPTKVERGNRIFPVNDEAESVLDLLKGFLKESGVKTVTGAKIRDFKLNGREIESVVLSDKIINTQKVIICTGGLSYPTTGSSGDGYKWAKKFGHTIVDPHPSLTPVVAEENWIKDLQGLGLENVKITVYQNNKKQDERFGEAMFTHDGLSGPILIDMSKKIGELLKNGRMMLVIDLKPALDYNVLDIRIQRDFAENKNRIFKNSLDALLPQKLIPVIINLSGIDPDKKVNEITKEERKKLLHLFKELKITVVELTGFEKAIITSGGVLLDEIESRTMRSKIIDNLYFAGEIIDLDGPTGGYNLQVCWSTGYLAGVSAAE